MQPIIPENDASDKIDDELDAIVAQLEAEKVTRAIARLDRALAPTGVSLARLLRELAESIEATTASPGLVETCGAQRNADGSVARDATGRPLPGELSHVPPRTDDEIDARNAAMRELPAERATDLVAGLVARLAPAIRGRG